MRFGRTTASGVLNSPSDVNTGIGCWQILSTVCKVLEIIKMWKNPLTLNWNKRYFTFCQIWKSFFLCVDDYFDTMSPFIEGCYSLSLASNPAFATTAVSMCYLCLPRIHIYQIYLCYCYMIKTTVFAILEIKCPIFLALIIILWSSSDNSWLYPLYDITTQPLYIIYHIFFIFLLAWFWMIFKFVWCCSITPMICLDMVGSMIHIVFCSLSLYL